MQITPEMLAKSGTEDGHQKALFCWCGLPEVRLAYPELQWLFHIPNGGFRSKAGAANLKAMGVKPGVPDLFLPVRKQLFGGLFVELKRAIQPGIKLNPIASNEQNKWVAYLLGQGYIAVVCYGWEEARDMLVKYLKD